MLDNHGPVWNQWIPISLAIASRYSDQQPPTPNTFVTTFSGRFHMSTFLGCYTILTEPWLQHESPIQWWSSKVKRVIFSSCGHPPIPGTEHEAHWNHSPLTMLENRTFQHGPCGFQVQGFCMFLCFYCVLNCHHVRPWWLLSFGHPSQKTHKLIWRSKISLRKFFPLSDHVSST